MSKITVFVGGLLCLTGILAYVTTGFEHATSLIPLFVGAPIGVCGLLTLKQPSKAKIYMHIAVALAILGFLASASRIPSLRNFGDIKSVSIWVMCVLCFILVGAFFQSFFKARMGKQG